MFWWGIRLLAFWGSHHASTHCCKLIVSCIATNTVNITIIPQPQQPHQLLNPTIPIPNLKFPTHLPISNSFQLPIFLYNLAFQFFNFLLIFLYFLINCSNYRWQKSNYSFKLFLWLCSLYNCMFKYSMFSLYFFIADYDWRDSRWNWSR